jgi:hypothetical protein
MGTMVLEDLDLLAQIAGFTESNETLRQENEILQEENQKVFTELEALRFQKNGCNDRSTWLPIADPIRLPALKQLPGESDGTFYRRKCSIYNRRAYKKKIGSQKEDNQNELESLRASLKESEERRSRLSAEAGSHVEPQCLGETKKELKKGRHQSTIEQVTKKGRRKWKWNGDGGNQAPYTCCVENAAWWSHVCSG